MVQPVFVYFIKLVLLLVEECMYYVMRSFSYLPPYILQNSMSVAAKRNNITHRFRKQNRLQHFSNIRMTLLAQFAQKEEHRTGQITSSGQYQIIEAIHNFRKDGNPIKFATVNQYILSAKGQFSQQFQEQLAKVVLESYRTNGHAIASLAHLLFYSTQIDFLAKIQGLKENLRQLIEANVTEDGESLKNGVAIAFLFFNILKWNQISQSLYFLPKFFKLFVSAIGYFDQSFLLMVEAASHCRYLLPQESFIQSLLTQQLPYQKLQPISLMVLCEMLENYVCFDLSQELYVQLAKWIERRLKQRKFSLQLKQNLIRIMTIALSYDKVRSVIDSEQADLRIFQEIANIARLGSPKCKQQALTCLTSLATCCSPQKLQYFVEYNQLMEIMIYSLEIQLDQELTFKLLETLAYILYENAKYRQMARNYGLICHLNRLAQNPNKQINEMASIVLDMYSQARK